MGLASLEPDGMERLDQRGNPHKTGRGAKRIRISGNKVCEGYMGHGLFAAVPDRLAVW